MAGALTALMKGAIRQGLMQTCEGIPVPVHDEPFADNIGMRLGGESGLGVTKTGGSPEPVGEMEGARRAPVSSKFRQDLDMPTKGIIRNTDQETDGADDRDPLYEVRAVVEKCLSQTTNLASVCRGADILVGAVGRTEMVEGDWAKPGAVMIDCGVNAIPDSTEKSGRGPVGDTAHTG